MDTTRSLNLSELLYKLDTALDFVDLYSVMESVVRALDDAPDTLAIADVKQLHQAALKRHLYFTGCAVKTYTYLDNVEHVNRGITGVRMIREHGYLRVASIWLHHNFGQLCTAVGFNQRQYTGFVESGGWKSCYVYWVFSDRAKIPFEHFVAVCLLMKIESNLIFSFEQFVQNEIGILDMYAKVQHLLAPVCQGKGVPVL